MDGTQLKKCSGRAVSIVSSSCIIICAPLKSPFCMILARNVHDLLMEKVDWDLNESYLHRHLPTTPPKVDVNGSRGDLSKRINSGCANLLYCCRDDTS
ncbi:hypothetical protein OG21DRAFT_1518482 [Imleria badia]|nr:hypothetical protein OG21DRAFT_1518482 [Imleria badia]